MMRNIGPPPGRPDRRIIVLIPLPRERKPKHSNEKKSRLHWLRPRLTAGYLLTGLLTGLWYTRSNEVLGTGYMYLSTSTGTKYLHIVTVK